jgi:rhodanese-related sulfurtransferase
MKQIIIDVREDYEFAQSHVNGAINIPPQRLMAGAEELGDVPKDTAIVLYCRSGARSSAAMNILRQQGFTNLTNGINEDHVKAKYLGR